MWISMGRVSRSFCFFCTWTLFLIIVSSCWINAQNIGDVRLLDTNDRPAEGPEGRVEVYNDNSKLSAGPVWARLCDDKWSFALAAIVCRQLGFPGASLVIRRSRAGEGSQSDTVKLDRCTAGRTSLSAAGCRIRDGGRTCGSGRDAGVKCRPMITTPPLNPQANMPGDAMTTPSSPGLSMGVNLGSTRRSSSNPSSAATLKKAETPIIVDVEETGMTTSFMASKPDMETTSKGVIVVVLTDKPPISPQTMKIIGAISTGVVFLGFASAICLIVVFMCKRKKSKAPKKQKSEPTEHEYQYTAAATSPKVAKIPRNTPASAPSIPMEDEYEYSAIGSSAKDQAQDSHLSPPPSNEYQFSNNQYLNLGPDVTGSGLASNGTGPGLGQDISTSTPRVSSLADVQTDENLYTVPDVNTSTASTYTSLNLKTNTFAGLQKIMKQKPPMRSAQQLPVQKTSSHQMSAQQVSARQLSAQQQLSTSLPNVNAINGKVKAKPKPPVSRKPSGGIPQKAASMDHGKMAPAAITEETYDLVGTRQSNPIPEQARRDWPSPKPGKPSPKAGAAARRNNIITAGSPSVPKKKSTGGKAVVKAMKPAPRIALKPVRGQNGVTSPDTDGAYDLIGVTPAKDSSLTNGTNGKASHVSGSSLKNQMTPNGLNGDDNSYQSADDFRDSVGTESSSIYANDVDLDIQRVPSSRSITIPEDSEIGGEYAEPRSLGISVLDSDNLYQNSQVGIDVPAQYEDDILYHNVSRKGTLPVKLH